MDDENFKNRRLMNIDFTKEEFFNLSKMLKASDEDRDLALETIKNLNLPEHYHTLFLKDLVFINRSRYKQFFNLDVTMANLSLMEMYSFIKSAKDPIAKDIYESIVTEVVNSGYRRFSFMTVQTKIKW